jgi:hypothetical protein
MIRLRHVSSRAERGTSHKLGDQQGNENARTSIGGPSPSSGLGMTTIEDTAQDLDCSERITRLVIQISKTIAIAHGARNAIATPIIRKLHIIALAL